MRVAALYDVHANLPALEAALADVRAAGPDLVLVGGDVLPGPMPAETLDCLLSLELPTRFIRGNGDRVVATALAGGDITEIPEPVRDVIEWTLERLTGAHRDALLSWRTDHRMDLPTLGATYFWHATPRNDVDIITKLTPLAELQSELTGVSAHLIVCGHTHMPFDRRVGAQRIVNAGSVGMPFLRPRGAYWLLLDDTVRLQRSAYDYESAADRLRHTGCPHVEALSVRYVVDPPTEAQSLDAMGRPQRASPTRAPHVP